MIGDHASLCGCDSCCAGVKSPRVQLRERLERAAAEVESWPASVRAAVPNVWEATRDATRDARIMRESPPVDPKLERLLGRDGQPRHEAGWGTFEEEEARHVYHPRPWWYRLAARVLPSRAREIPDAREPGRVLLRQLAIVKRRVYLQGFASGEDPRWYHAHGAPLLVIGLWGSYVEWRPAGSWPRTDSSKVAHRRAPYVFSMGAHELHSVDAPSKGHTSIAIYFGEPERVHHPVDGGPPVSWREHVRKRVRRL